MARPERSTTASGLPTDFQKQMTDMSPLMRELLEPLFSCIRKGNFGNRAGERKSLRDFGESANPMTIEGHRSESKIEALIRFIRFCRPKTAEKTILSILNEHKSEDSPDIESLSDKQLRVFVKTLDNSQLLEEALDKKLVPKNDEFTRLMLDQMGQSLSGELMATLKNTLHHRNPKTGNAEFLLDTSDPTTRDTYINLTREGEDYLVEFSHNITCLETLHEPRQLFYAEQETLKNKTASDPVEDAQFKQTLKKSIFSITTKIKLSPSANNPFIPAIRQERAYDARLESCDIHGLKGLNFFGKTFTAESIREAQSKQFTEAVLLDPIISDDLSGRSNWSSPFLMPPIFKILTKTLEGSTVDATLPHHKAKDSFFISIPGDPPNIAIKSEGKIIISAHFLQLENNFGMIVGYCYKDAAGKFHFEGQDRTKAFKPPENTQPLVTLSVKHTMLQKDEIQFENFQLKTDPEITLKVGYTTVRAIEDSFNAPGLLKQEERKLLRDSRAPAHSQSSLFGVTAANQPQANTVKTGKNNPHQPPSIATKQ